MSVRVLLAGDRQFLSVIFGSSIRGCGSLIGGKGGSDIRVGGRTSGIAHSADSGSVALSSADNSSTCF